MFIIGGCDYSRPTCFNDLYTLDMLTLWWVQLKETEDFPALERGGLAAIGGILYNFGGCYRD